MDRGRRMPGVTRVLTYRGRGIARLASALKSQMAAGGVGLQGRKRARLRLICIQTESPDTVIRKSLARSTRAAGRYRRFDVLGFGKILHSFPRPIGNDRDPCVGSVELGLSECASID